MKINELHQEWFAYKEQRVKPSSLASYETAYATYIAPYFQGWDMQQGVNNKQMNSFIDHLLHERGLSRKSAQDVKIVLGNILKYGSMEHDIPLFTYMIEYPTASMEKQHDLHYFTKEQCKTVFKAMDCDPSGELLGMVIGLTTGMRIGEIVGLRFEDVDFDAKTITVNRTIERVICERDGTKLNLDGVEVLSMAPSGRSAIVANPPKTSSSHRTCPLSALPMKWLRNYSKVQKPDRYIVSMSTKPIEPRTYRNWYYQELDKLGLPRLHPHCMRHTFASQPDGCEVFHPVQLLKRKDAKAGRFPHVCRESSFPGSRSPLSSGILLPALPRLFPKISYSCFSSFYIKLPIKLLRWISVGPFSFSAAM